MVRPAAKELSMNAPDKLPVAGIADVQGFADSRNIAIDDVGIRGLRYPLQVAGRDGKVQATVAEMQLTVALPAEVKGTHMSRLVALIEEWAEPMSAASLARLGQGLIKRLEAERGSIDMSFPYFIRKTAPVSGVESLLDYTAAARVTADVNGQSEVVLKMTTPVTSLCPCSREISDYGAHNQRSHVTIEASIDPTRADLTLEDLASIAEGAASCEIWGLLKRPDEKYVTERAYDNAKFVEDLVRDVAIAMNAHPAVTSYVVEAENFESIHNHSAYARIARRK
jgi:GTP cyclohydrolase FolE2